MQKYCNEKMNFLKFSQVMFLYLYIKSWFLWRNIFMKNFTWMVLRRWFRGYEDYLRRSSWRPVRVIRMIRVIVIICIYLLNSSAVFDRWYARTYWEWWCTERTDLPIARTCTRVEDNLKTGLRPIASTFLYLGESLCMFADWRFDTKTRVKNNGK